jgi:hypothetical protein
VALRRLTLVRGELGKMRGLAVIVGTLVVGCGTARYSARETGAPSMTIPVHFAEGHGGGGPPPLPSALPSNAITVGSALPTVSALPAPSASPDPRAALPDPSPLVTADQWEFDLVYEKGTLRSKGVRHVVLERPTPTPRRFGRFAVELWLGKELIERARFDFPLLGGDVAAEGVKHPLHDLPRFAPGVETEARVLVPDSERATSAVLVDRLTGSAVPLTWPPAQTPAPPDGGVTSPH